MINNKPLQDPQMRFMFDNLIDAVKDQTLLLWEALDTQTQDRVWILGRKISETQVMPLGQLLPDSTKTVQRYAPALLDGTWDYSMISKIIKP
jgi:hypothetical protein